jgi:hypothetical protein
MNRATSLCAVLASVALASTLIAAEVAAQAITVVPASPTVAAWADEIENGERQPTNKGVDLRSHGRQIADQIHRRGSAVSSEPASLADRRSEGGREQESGREQEDRCEGEDHCEKKGLNAQVNAPALDHLQTVPGTRPYEFSIQSETSIASFRNSIVIGYNSSADQGVVPTGPGFFAHFSGFSVSHDGGPTWTSGFVPPVPGSPFTFGDPSVGVDRDGHFYYVSLGADAPNVYFADSTGTSRTFAFSPAPGFCRACACSARGRGR